MWLLIDHTNSNTPWFYATNSKKSIELNLKEILDTFKSTTLKK